MYCCGKTNLQSWYITYAQWMKCKPAIKVRVNRKVIRYIAILEYLEFLLLHRSTCN